MGRLRDLAARTVELREGEGPALGWASSYFFLLLASYYVLRPLRDEMGVRGSQDALSWLFVGTLVGTAALNPLFGALVSRHTRKVFVPVVYRVLIATLVVFWALLTFAPAPWHAPGRPGLLRLGERLQPLRDLGLLGLPRRPLPPRAGAAPLRLHRRRRDARRGRRGRADDRPRAPLGPTNLLLLAALLLEGAVVCVRGLVRHFGVDDTSRTGAEIGAEAEGVPPGTGAFSGLRIVSRSGYLLAISLFLLFYTVSSTFLYFEQARIVKAAFTDSAQRTAFFARIDLWVNLLAAFTQVFLTGRVVKALGVGGTLAALPLVTAAGFGALAVSPTTGVLVLVMVARRAADFALFRPAREVLFTVLPREEKYAAKNFVDTFVYRFGDAVGAFADKGLRAIGAMGATVAALFLPAAVAWALLSAWLGRRQARLAAARAAATGVPARRGYHPGLMDWLLKTEPSDYSFEDLVREKTTAWTGVTSPAARKNLRSMSKGDRVVVYHTGDVRAAVGLATVASSPRPDPADPKGTVVDVKAGQTLKRPVTLDEVKKEKLFAASPLVTIGRLSVVPLTPEQYAFLMGE